jgi:hypothetical protein
MKNYSILASYKIEIILTHLQVELYSQAKYNHP